MRKFARFRSDMVFRSRFFRHIFTLFSGSALAQAANFGIYFVVAQLYTPEDFGYFALYTATVLIAADMSNARYDLSILLPKEEAASDDLVRLCLSIALALSVFSAAMIYIVRIPQMIFPENGIMVFHFLFFPLSLFLIGAIQPLTNLMNRLQQYRHLTISKILQVLLMGLATIGMGLAGETGKGLLYGFVAGQLGTVIYLFITAVIYKKDILKNFSVRAMKLQAREYSYFPRYSITSAVLNTASRQSPVYLLGLYFGLPVAGSFNMAFRLLAAPVMLVAQSYGQVFYERAAKLHQKRQSDFPLFIWRNVRNLFLMGLVPLLVIMIWGVELTVLLLGEKWMDAAYFIQYLAPWTLMLFILNPLSYVLNIKMKLRNELLYNILLFIARLGILILGGYYWSAENTVAGYSVVGVVFSIMLLLYILHISGFRFASFKLLWKGSK
ncbi:MAG: oligosaccharide flippase family protein [Bacteroidia bacterium]